MRIKSRPAHRPPRQAPDIGSLLTVAAEMVWLPQAALLALALDGLLAGAAVSALALGLGFLALGTVRSVLAARAQAELSRAANARIMALRDEIVTREAETVQVSDLGGPGALAALTADKLEALRPMLVRYAPARLRVMLLPPTILILSAWFSWAVALVLLMAGPLIPLFMALVGWAAKSASARQMDEIGSLNDLLADRLAALADLRLIGAGTALADGFAAASESLRARTMGVLRIAFLSSTVLELFSALGVAMVAVWVGFSLLGVLGWGTWGAPLSPFAGLFLLLLAPEFFQPLRDLAAAWHDKAAADAVRADLSAWRDQPRQHMPGLGQTARPRPFAGMSLRGVTLRGAACPDLDIAPGDSVALVGPSGAGKTTLLRLIAGLELAEAGSIRLGDRMLNAETAASWRAAIGWMPQAPAFPGRSLRHVIGFGAAVDRDLLQAVGLGPVLRRLPRGDLTILGERGAGLSGGEARRIMLARALHGAPPVLLADEPTADLDDATAARVTEALLRHVGRGGTLIVATHDPRLAGRMARRIDLRTAA